MANWAGVCLFVCFSSPSFQHSCWSSLWSFQRCTTVTIFVVCKSSWLVRGGGGEVLTVKKENHGEVSFFFFFLGKGECVRCLVTALHGRCYRVLQQDCTHFNKYFWQITWLRGVKINKDVHVLLKLKKKKKVNRTQTKTKTANFTSEIPSWLWGIRPCWRSTSGWPPPPFSPPLAGWRSPAPGEEMKRWRYWTRAGWRRSGGLKKGDFVAVFTWRGVKATLELVPDERSLTVDLPPYVMLCFCRVLCWQSNWCQDSQCRGMIEASQWQNVITTCRKKTKQTQKKIWEWQTRPWKKC